jgi:hypothetical protein
LFTGYGLASGICLSGFRCGVFFLCSCFHTFSFFQSGSGQRSNGKCTVDAVGWERNGPLGEPTPLPVSA